MKPLPTDFEILDLIYEKYYENFKNFEKGNDPRASKIYVPIRIPKIAAELGVDGDIVFGRLYYHLENKYSYNRRDGGVVHFLPWTKYRAYALRKFSYAWLRISINA